MYGAIATRPNRKGMITSIPLPAQAAPGLLRPALRPYAGYGAQPSPGALVANGYRTPSGIWEPEPGEGDLPKGALIAGGGLLVAALVLGPFVIGPWAVKQFKPDWTYGKRLVTSLLVTSGIGIVKKAVD